MPPRHNPRFSVLPVVFAGSILLALVSALLPISLYAAGKLSCEAFISGFCNLFGLRAYIFRFGNVVGGRMSHDEAVRLQRMARGKGLPRDLYVQNYSD